jgi:hypothetical protein
MATAHRQSKVQLVTASKPSRAGELSLQCEVKRVELIVRYDTTEHGTCSGQAETMTVALLHCHGHCVCRLGLSKMRTKAAAFFTVLFFLLAHLPAAYAQPANGTAASVTS